MKKPRGETRMTAKSRSKKAVPATSVSAGKAGTKKKTRDGSQARFEINARALVAALEAHALGKAEMTPAQVSAALALLKLQGALAETTETTTTQLSHEEALAALA